MINRAAVVLKYKAPAIKWINDADPYRDDSHVTLESANSDRTVYLIMEQYGDTPEARDEWITLNYEALFMNELEGWYTDESLWPGNRDIKLFHEWFEVECHTVIEDTVEGLIEDDDA